MLPILMYHDVSIEPHKYCNSIEIFEKHIKYIAENYVTILPGEKIVKNSICLTFDDGFFSFYHYVFPLLKKYDLKALFSVPIRFIVEHSDLRPEDRIHIPYTTSMRDGLHKETHPFATWEEQREMIASGHVKIASHAYSHQALTLPDIDLYKEIVESKNILEEKLGCEIDTFVYPKGRFNGEIHRMAQDNYQYIMPIGGAFNSSWEGCQGLLFRISGDNLQDYRDPLNWKVRAHAYAKYLLNKIRY